VLLHNDTHIKAITSITQSIFINGTQVPYANTAKYLGITLDAKLRWKEYIKKKRDELNKKFRKMYWLLGRNSEYQPYIIETNSIYIQFGVMVMRQ
jgi:hypothetical protein